MGLSLRYYLFPEGAAPLRLSKRLVQGLIDGTDRAPQYANTKQRVLEVVLESDDRKPVQILDANGAYWVFDGDGDIGDGLRESVRDAMDLAFDRPRESGVVVSLEPKRRRKELKDRNRWVPTSAELDLVAADIWPKGAADRLHAGKGVAPKTPPLTYDAERAMEESSKDFFLVEHQIGRLKAPSLKGFAFEARRRSQEGDHPELYNALAEMADNRLERLRARSSSKGAWYAWVSLTRWDDTNVGEETFFVSKKCDGRATAEKVAAELVREHAGKITYDTSIDSGVQTELDWRRDARHNMDE